MTITLGSLTLSVNYRDGIRPVYRKRTAEHSILGATNSKRQNLGRDSTQYKLRGVTKGTNKDSEIATLRNYYLNHDEILFSGYAGDLNVRIIQFQENDMTTYWEYEMLLEVTGA